MGKLLDPILDKVIVEVTDDEEQRRKDFFSMLAKAVNKAEENRQKDKEDE